MNVRKRLPFPAKKPRRPDSACPDYSRPEGGFRFYARGFAEGCLIAAAVNYLFYRRLIVFLFMAPLPFLWLRYRLKEQKKARLKQLNYDFREALDSLTVSLRAGSAVERAFEETEANLRSQIGERDLTREFAYMNDQIRLKVPAEDLMLELGGKTGIEDITDFAAVFASAKRLGGPMADIMTRAAQIISDKIDVEREIASAVAAKSFEQKIMSVTPAFFIVYMQLSSPGFLSVLYTSLFGAILMTACLAGYIAAIWLGRRIVTIEV